MPNPDNEPQIPKNQSPISDDRTGFVSRDWYRFFLNLLNKANEGGGGGGSGTVTSVSVSGGATGMSFSGNPVTTSGTITMTGTLDLNNGGTGATTAADARTALDVPSTSGGGATGTWPISVSGNAANVTGTVAVANGGTGATNATDARTNLGAAASGANADITSMTGITGGISSPDYVQFDTTATVTDATGRLYYAADDQFQTLSFQMNGSSVQRIGEELYYRVKLTSAATKGQVLMFTGTLGASGGLTAAPATGLQPEQANYILGVAAESGITNDWVFVTTFGEVKEIDTTGGAETWAQGDILFYDPTVTGGLTKTKPAVPNAICVVAAVVHVGSTNGVLFVRPTFGSVLGGTDGNVQITTPTSGNTLIYDAVAGVWENANLTDGDGISITEGAGSITVTNTGVRTAQAGDGISVTGTNDITITNTGVRTIQAGTGISISGTNDVTVTNSAPDQVVSLTAGTGISTSGTYPNFTIDNTAPDQVVSLTGAGTTSVTGTYPNFTITSNDQYVGTVTSVSGTGTVNGISLSGTVTSSGSLTLGGTLTGVDLASQVTGTLPIANGGTGQTTQTAAFDALSPTTTKGDLIVSDGTDNVRQAVGANNYVLTADSTQATGIKWAPASGSGLTISNDTSTATNLYPTFASATSGAMSTIYTSDPNLLYKPSTGELTSERFISESGFFLNKLSVDASYTVPTGYSAMSAGTITIASGVTITVSSGSRWVVV
jgi:hypothetical protein